jgi:hypothetical protein
VAGSVNIADLVKWPKALVDRYNAGTIATIRTSLKLHGVAQVQVAIDGTVPYPPVNTGGYRRGWKVRELSNGAFLFNPDRSASIIERGRRPGFGVSKEGREALARWVHLHGMDRAGPLTKRQRAARRRMRDSGVGKEGIRARGRWQQANRALGIAFLIAREIKRRGLPAKRVLARAKPGIIRLVMADVDAFFVKGPA